MIRNLSTHALGFWAPQNEQIELALSYGFRSIDVDIVDFSEQVESRTLSKARRLIDSAKIALGAFPLPVNLDAEDDAYREQLHALDGLARLAAEVGCRRSVVKVAAASNTRPMHDNFELHRARLAEIAAVLEGPNIRLGIDFDAPAHHRDGKQFEFVYDFETLKQLVDSVSRENVGFVIDVWQLHVCGAGLDVVKELSPERIVYVKIADAPTKAAAGLTEEGRLSPGTGGALDLVGFVKALVAMNYEGPLTPVLSLGQFHGRRRDQAIKMTGLALDEVCFQAGLPRLLKPPPPPEPPKAPKKEVSSEEVSSEEVSSEEVSSEEVSSEDVSGKKAPSEDSKAEDPKKADAKKAEAKQPAAAGT